MKKILYQVLFCLTSFIPATGQNLIVKGEITDCDTVMLLLRSMDKIDTIYTNNGKFTFKRHIISPELFRMVCIKSKQSIEAIKEGNESKIRSDNDVVSKELFLEGGEVIINTSFSSFSNTKIVLVKHAMQDKYDEFKKRFNPLVKMARTIIDSSIAHERTGAEKEIFKLLYDRLNNIESEVAEKFTIENADNAVGAYVLYRYVRIEDHHKLDSLYKLFDTSLQATAYLKNIKNKIKALSILKTGQGVPVFIATGSNGKIISLLDLRGKYVVLDFWGSWCPPCIGGFPKMKEYYKKFSNKVEFVGVSCRDKETEWRNAIKKNDLSWLHILNANGANDLAVMYNVEAYPTKLLIDKDGKLIQIFIGESNLFYQKLDSLFGNNKK